MVLTQEIPLGEGATNLTCTEHKCSLTLKVTAQSNSLLWLGDAKSHTLSSTNQMGYKVLSALCQSFWIDHNPFLECRNHQHWVTWEEKKC